MAKIRWVLASDIDGTLVGHGGESELVRFLQDRPEIGLVYLTGRTRSNAEALLDSHGFPRPLALATDLGADVYWGASLSLDEAWAFQQRCDWSPRQVLHALDAVEGVSYQSRCSYWRLAFYVRDLTAVGEARAQLVHQGVVCRTLFDEEARRLDVVPRSALKGRALKYILNQLHIRAQQCFVAGDAENDGDLLAGRYHGVVVANGSVSFKEKLPDTIMRSNYPGAQGVLDGLTRFLKRSDWLSREHAG